jgi:outer membrane protein assembly factor BamB
LRVLRVLILLLMGLGCAGSAQDWPQLLGPTRNGVYAGSNLLSAWPKEGPRVVWRKDVGQGFSGPVSASNQVVLFHRVEDNERIECVDAQSGRTLWAFDYATAYRDDFGFDEGPRATPTISGNRVYTYGAEGMLHCVDFSTGKKLWNVDCKTEFGARKGFFGIACSPLVSGDLVLVDVGGSKAGIVAFDRETGKVAWKTPASETSYSSPAAANIGGKTFAFFFRREGLEAIEPATGKTLWEFPWRPSIGASVNAATPIIAGDLIFMSTSYGRGAAALRFGGSKPEVLWSGDDQLSNHYATSVHHGGYLYGYHGRQEYGCDLRCVELKTGKVMWTAERFGAGTIMVAGNDLLLLTEKGELIKAPADPKQFKTSARAQVLGLETRAYPALANGLFFGRDKRRLVCVDLKNH